MNMAEQSGSHVTLRSQPFAQPEALHTVVTETYKRLKQRRPVVLTSMALYISNRDTEYILFKPIKVTAAPMTS